MKPYSSARLMGWVDGDLQVGATEIYFTDVTSSSDLSKKGGRKRKAGGVDERCGIHPSVVVT
jgi:hypothetical protein